MPGEKALYLAGNVASGPWAAGKAWGESDSASAERKALQLCNAERSRFGVAQPCKPYLVNEEFVFFSRQRQDDAPPPERQIEEVTVSTGTCFAVSDAGIILTAYHIVSGKSHINVIFPDDEVLEANVLTSSERLDVAVLDADVKGIPWLPFAKSGSYESGDYVFVLGYPVRHLLGDEVKFTDGSIASLSGLSSEASFMQISAPVQPGSSGSPVLSERGEVVGMVVSTAAVEAFLRAAGALPQSINWATNVDFVRPLVGEQVPSLPVSERRTAIDRAKQATCMVEAW